MARDSSSLERTKIQRGIVRFLVGFSFCSQTARFLHGRCMVRIFCVGLAAVILAKLCAETDGRYAVTGVVLASLLINVVEFLGADGVVRLEAEIALGHHEVDDIVAAALDGVYVGGGFRADRKSEVILHQPVRPFQTPQQDALQLGTHLLHREGVIRAIGRLVLGGQDMSSLVERLGFTAKGPTHRHWSACRAYLRFEGTLQGNHCVTGASSYTRSNCARCSADRWWLMRISVRSGLVSRLFSTRSAFF